MTMGVELHIGCDSCRNWAWLGSAKPHKWQGFQVGNEVVASWLVAHAHIDAASSTDLELWRDDGPEAPWTLDAKAWTEDERSLGVNAGALSADIAQEATWSFDQATALWLSCSRCSEKRVAVRIFKRTAVLEGATELAAWMLQHAAPSCALTVSHAF